MYKIHSIGVGGGSGQQQGGTRGSNGILLILLSFCPFPLLVYSSAWMRAAVALEQASNRPFCVYTAVFAAYNGLYTNVLAVLDPTPRGSTDSDPAPLFPENFLFFIFLFFVVFFDLGYLLLFALFEGLSSFGYLRFVVAAFVVLAFCFVFEGFLRPVSTFQTFGCRVLFRVSFCGLKSRILLVFSFLRKSRRFRP